MDNEILKIIESTSSGKLKYMEKQAKKKNFDSVYDYLLDIKNQKEKVAVVEKSKLYAKDVNALFTKFMQSAKQGKSDLGFRGKDLETLFKAYGAFNPYDLKDGDLKNPEVFPTLGNLKFLLETFLTDKIGGSSKAFQKHFLENEHLITNDEMFWMVCSTFWCVSNVGFTEETFNRYGRTKVPLEKRIECSIRLERFSNNKKHPVFSLDYQVERLKEWVEPNKLAPAFRVFKVGSGKPVRQSVVKDHPDQYIHNEGSSWCYSFQKSLASIVGLVWNRHLIKKYAECTDEEVETILKSLYEGDDQKNLYDATLYDGFYQCIGVFGVEKENIQFLTDKWGEDEIVINPEDARLIDYRFANAVDLMTVDVVRVFLTMNKSVAKRINRSSFVGIDGLFDLFRVCVKKSLDEDPTQIKKYLHQPQRMRLPFTASIENKVEELCGAKLALKVIEQDYDNLITLYVGDVLLERFNDGIRQKTAIPKKYIQH